jgi:DNA-binding NarL/FixJ family response regulator
MIGKRSAATMREDFPIGSPAMAGNEYVLVAGYTKHQVIIRYARGAVVRRYASELRKPVATRPKLNRWTQHEMLWLQELVAEGWTNNEIAATLERSPAAVRTMRYQVCEAQLRSRC